jgi:hypothetical protein
LGGLLHDRHRRGQKKRKRALRRGASYSAACRAWEIRRAPEQLAVRLQKDGFNPSKAALRAGKRALHTLLENLSGENLIA